MTERLEKVLKFLTDNNLLSMQMFDSRNIVWDTMENLYSEDGVVIDICRKWNYLEILGLTDEEVKILAKKHFETGAKW